ncbi:MAG: hypothetical protein K1X57_15575 [Gemmataceae bacterium]|nr:hypothetical protein [Gemmataceae bacterium]
MQEFRRGAAAYNRGDDAAAESAFSAGLSLDPTSANAYLFRGLTRLRVGQEDAALLDFAAAGERDPACVDAAWARARVLAVRGQWRDASREFSRVIALRPDDAKAIACRGESRYHLEEWAGCLADYRLAARLEPTDYKHLNRLAWVLATCPDPALRNADAALELAEQANRLAGGLDPLVVDTVEVARNARGDSKSEPGQGRPASVD